MSEKIKKPRDINQLAKLIVDITTGEAERPDDKLSKKNPAALELGRIEGLKGGKSRAKKLPTEQGAEMAKKAAKKDGNIKNNQFSI